ncbi:MAG: hypothetical protein FIA99_01880 [Ruminiclostridium sp.]|nr:hypothetical protein [Ruminiclostridium sp.]
MNKSKGMQLGAMLVAMLILSMAFVPAVSAKADTEASDLSDPTVIKALIDKLNKEGDNAYKAFEKLSPQEQAAVIKASKVDKITPTRTEASHKQSSYKAYTQRIRRL